MRFAPTTRQSRSRGRRPAAALLAVAALALLLAACGGSSPSTTDPGNGGSLRVGLSSAMSTLNPLPFGAKSYFVWNLLYDTPITLSDGKPQPGLVESWTMAKDNRSLTLKLKSGVTYSDGTKFDAKALAWNIDWQKKPENASHGLDLWTKVTATAVDATTVKLTFPQPIPAIYGMLAQVPILKPDKADSGVGTGPFKVVSFKPGTSLTVARNPHYWRSGLPHLDRITMTNYADPASAALAQKSGTIDVYVVVRPSLVDGLKSAGNEVMNPTTAGMYVLLFNTSKAPLNDARVRQALSLAFNRDAFVKTSLFDLAKPLYSVLPPASPVYDPSLNRGEFNLDKAKALLQQAGVGNLTLDIDSPTILPQNDFLPVYQQDLKKIGVTLRIHQIDVATWAKEASTGSFAQLLSQGYAAPDYDPATFFGQVNLRPQDNSAHFSSPQYAKLMQAAALETDPAKRKADYAAVARFVQEQAFVVPLSTLPWPTVYAPKVTGVRPGFVGLPEWSEVGLGG